MKAEPKNLIDSPPSALFATKVKVQFAAAFPVEFVIQRLEDVSLGLPIQVPESSAISVAALETLQSTQL